jgi:ATP-binding cassette subfamily B multidrug efflux pump
MLRLLTFLVPHRKLVAALVLANFALSGLLIVTPLVIKAIVDDVIGGQQMHLLLPYLGLLFGVTVLRSAAGYFYTYGQNELGQLLMTDVRTALYRKLLVLPYSFYDREQTGRLISRLSSDVESTRLFLSQILIESFSHATTIVLATAAMFAQDLGLALLVAGPLIASGVGMYLAHHRLSAPWAEQHERFARMSAKLQDILAGIKVVKAFAQEPQEARKFMAAVADVRAGSLLIGDLWNRSWSVLGSIGRFVQLLLIGVGGYGVMNGALSLGALVAMISLSLLLLNAVNALGTQLNAFSQTATAAVRVFELLDEPVPIKSPAQPQPLPRPLRGEIRFESVSFRYPTSTGWALHDVTLHIPAGSSLALVGATGSGKSTLVQLIGRFYDPTAGRVLIDGHDVRTLDLAELRRQIGVVMQDALLFSTTIAENIAFGRPDVPREAIERAARLAQAHEFITKLPQGYDTLIGERGVGLSGGQRQRIAIARAILLDPRILILDDAMSAVDAETEKLLQAAIGAVMRGRTTILIAHRLSTVEQADQIAVLHQGRIAELGTHETLMRSSSYYRRVFDMQRMSAAEAMSEYTISSPA